MKILGRHKSFCGFVGLMLLAARAFGEVTDDFQALQLRLNDTLLDVYAGSAVAPGNSPLKLLETLRPALQSEAARRLVDSALAQRDERQHGGADRDAARGFAAGCGA